VVDTLGPRSVKPSLLWLLQRRNIPDVGDGVSWNTGPNFVILVVFIIEEEIMLIFRVENLALMGVGSTLIGCNGQDLGVLLVCNVVDGKSVLVVAITDFFAQVLGVGTLVRQALSIVDIPVGRSTSGASWVCWIGNVDKDNT
jgi:hypothetical protein